MRYQDILPALRSHYDSNVAERDGPYLESWKAKERGVFLEFLYEQGAQTLLELGSGPGRDGVFFRDHGLQVTCTDLSPEMVASCRAKDLEALAVDFLNLDFADCPFDAIYALNSLLHVPKDDLPAVLERIQAQLVPGSIFYLGVYGGRNFEGIRPDDRHEPKRFFAFYKDCELLTRLTSYFELVYFRRVAVSKVRSADFHFQSFVLQRGKE